MAEDDGILVMKFGGTSMGGAERMRQVTAIVAAAGAPRIVVVVSAMAGVTDALLEACRKAAAGDDDGARGAVDAIEARHLETIHRLGCDGPLDGENLTGAIRAECGSLRTVLTSVGVLREITPRGLDRVAAAGELMSSRILAALLSASGLPARWIDPRRALVTSDAFGAATPVPAYDEAVRRETAPALNAGGIVVTGGFVGATTQGITTTLGRGGSDYSAAIFGAALGARDPDLDRRGRHADADPADRAGGAAARKPLVRRSVGTGLLRRQGPAPEHDPAGDRSGHSRTDPQHDAPVRARQPHHRGSGVDERPLAAIACKRNITVVNVTLDAHAAGARLPQARLRGVRAARRLRWTSSLPRRSACR
jgi:hypothetical protein